MVTERLSRSFFYLTEYYPTAPNPYSNQKGGRHVDTAGPGHTPQDVDRIHRFYERFAPSYDGWMRSFDRFMLGDARRSLCARAAGRTLEVAVGTGLNLVHYPASTELTGIDLSPAMLALARRRALELGREADLRPGDAQQLDFPDASFDTVVFSLCLCTIPDERRALAEAHRVLRPQGRLLLLEHVRSDLRPVQWLQRLLEPPMARFTGDHVLRDPLDHLAATGFVVEHASRSKWGIIEQVVALRD